MAVRIATFNLESLGADDVEPSALEERIQILQPQLRRLKADIVCLQEINGQRSKEGSRRLLALDRLLEGTPYAAYERAFALGPASKLADRHNVVTLSRFPIRAIHSVRHDLVPPPVHRSLVSSESGDRPVEWDRPLLHTPVSLPGGRVLHVINLHLRAPLAAHIPGQKESAYVWKSIEGWAEGFFLATLKRVGQALEARLLLERIFEEDRDALLLICGDFNAEESETPLRMIRGDVADTGNGLLADRMLIPLERTLPSSQRFSVIHAGRQVMLDHILASRTLMAAYRHMEVHNEGLGDELVAFATVHASPESYHAPLVAEFDFPDRSGAGTSFV